MTRASAPREGTSATRAAAWPIATALRRALARGYGLADLRADALAGLTVGIVAIPLSMALGIATGVAPENGLYTAIVAGFVVAVLGGSAYQVTGPTAAFLVVLAPIASRHGLSGLLTAGLLAGIILVAMGAARLGRLVQFIPHPVTTGFTAGIATVIATLQLKDALGLRTEHLPDAFPEKVAALWAARGTASPVELAVAALTLALLLGVPRVTRRVPAPLVAIGVASLLVAAATRAWPELHVATLGTRFHTVVHRVVVPGIPQVAPHAALPWGDHPLTLAYVRELLPSAFAIAMLGAIESLLSAVIADGMTGSRHDANAELVALGLGNVIAPFFGGIAATGALARTATNVRSGARSPIAAALHALVVLGAILAFAPLVAWVPMASLAALLLLVAWNMSEARHALHVLRVAPQSDVLVLVTCYVLTVVFDMVVSVGAGVVLGSLLFMRRMAELTRYRVHDEGAHERTVPEKTALYEIAGPLFFGAAENAMSALDAIGADVSVVVLALGECPVIDASGLVALESALVRLHRARKFVILAGPLPEPREVFDRANLERHHDNITLAGDVDEALATARDLVLLHPEWSAAPQSAKRA